MDATLSSSSHRSSNSDELNSDYALNSDHALNFDHESKPHYVAGQAGTPGQGPHMLIVLQVKEGWIVKAQFSTYGCPAAVACGQFVTEQVEGKDWRDVERAGIYEETIIAGVGQMPLGREHCPGLAVKAMQQALEQLKSAEERPLVDKGGVMIVNVGS